MEGLDHETQITYPEPADAGSSYLSPVILCPGGSCHCAGAGVAGE